MVVHLVFRALEKVSRRCAQAYLTQRVHIYYYHGIRPPKAIVRMVFWGLIPYSQCIPRPPNYPLIPNILTIKDHKALLKGHWGSWYGPSCLCISRCSNSVLSCFRLCLAVFARYHTRITLGCRGLGFRVSGSVCRH